jgi:flagellar hook protein FlgE
VICKQLIYSRLASKINKQQTQRRFSTVPENIASEKEKRMNAKQANSISITSYLKAKGIAPKYTTPHQSMYQAPYRKDDHAFSESQPSGKPVDRLRDP